jgi:hypothetical protein
MGINEDRLIFLDPPPMDKHILVKSLADLALDTPEYVRKIRRIFDNNMFSEWTCYWGGCIMGGGSINNSSIKENGF